jgi:hypothetical protein
MNSRFSRLFGLFAIWFALVSLACNAQNSLLATPTPAATFTPTATLTPTLLPMPDFKNAVLKSADFSADFRVLPNLPPNGVNQASYGFINAKKFQIIYGSSVPILSEQDNLGFEVMVNNPDMLMKATETETKVELKNIKTISGMDRFGDISSAFTAKTNIKNIPVQADFFIMRKGTLGTIVFSVYKIGSIPTISIQEIAKKLESRFNVVLGE